MNPPKHLKLSPADEAAGFRLLIIESDGVNPDELVVGYVLSPSEIIIKTTLFGRIVYKLRRWGIVHHAPVPGLPPLPPSERSEWTPVGMSVYHDPAEAIRECRSQPDETLTPPIDARDFHHEPYDPVKHGS